MHDVDLADFVVRLIRCPPVDLFVSVDWVLQEDEVKADRSDAAIGIPKEKASAVVEEEQHIDEIVVHITAILILTIFRLYL